jgi:phytoene desaturase
MNGGARRAVVIGGGLGGLAAALRLNRDGWNVTLCEQASRCGGKMNTLTARGFQFDTGPSLVTMPWVFAELFECLGERMEDHLDLVKLHPHARYYHGDGTRYDYTANLPEWNATLKNLGEPGDDGFLRYMKLGARLYELSKETFLRRPLSDPPDWRTLRALRHFPIRHAWGAYHRTVEAHFRSPHLRQLYNRYPTYVGSSPFKSPATLTLIPYLEYAFGGWYIRGGLYKLVETLVELARARGVHLLTDARVEGIDLRGKRVSGVRLARGERLGADIVVMNGDASTAAGLIEPGKPPLPERERSMSGFVLLLGLSREFPELHHHNVCFSDDYTAEFRQLFDEFRFPDDPTVYVNVPSRTDRTRAPGPGETVFLMANAPAADAPWTPAATAAARARVFARLRACGMPDFEPHIVAEQAVTPTWMADHFLMPGGAIYGANSHGRRNAFHRHPNRDPKVGGLYFAGGSAHPGGGTPIVLISAQIVANLVKRHERA